MTFFDMLVDATDFSFSSSRGFLVIEGVNGAGKTTLQEKVKDYLTGLRQNVLCTREPGATELGKVLRNLLLDYKSEKTVPLAEVFLFAADRAQHVKTVIEPALERGEIVISDRFLYSTEVFQGYGRGQDAATIQEVNRLAVDGTYPDFVILLDLEPEEGLLRAKKRGALEKDRFEQEELAFQQRIRSGFLEIARLRPEPFLVVDASQTQEAIFEAVKPVLDKWRTALANHRS
jgi:dTMP kinase